MALVGPLRIPLPGLTREVGAGDAVRAGTRAMGVEPCTPCERRRQALNRRVVFVPPGNGQLVRGDRGA